MDFFCNKSIKRPDVLVKCEISALLSCFEIIFFPMHVNNLIKYIIYIFLATSLADLRRRKYLALYNIEQY